MDFEYFFLPSQYAKNRLHAKLVTVCLHFYMYIHVTRYKIRSASFVPREKHDGGC